MIKLVAFVLLLITWCLLITWGCTESGRTSSPATTMLTSSDRLVKDVHDLSALVTLLSADVTDLAKIRDEAWDICSENPRNRKIADHCRTMLEIQKKVAERGRQIHEIATQ
jgi:hypothetical protein